MEAFLPSVNDWSLLLKEPDVLKESLSKLWGGSSFWTNRVSTTQTGVLLTTRSGGCSFWNDCSTTWWLWGGGRCSTIWRDAPTPTNPLMAKEMAPFHPLVRSLLGLAEEEILKLAEDISCGQYWVVPSILPWLYQDQLMEDLHRELGQQLCATTGQTGPCPRAGGIPRHALKSSAWSPLSETGRKNRTSTHCSVGAAIH